MSLFTVKGVILHGRPFLCFHDAAVFTLQDATATCRPTRPSQRRRLHHLPARCRVTRPLGGGDDAFDTFFSETFSRTRPLIHSPTRHSSTHPSTTRPVSHSPTYFTSSLSSSVEQENAILRARVGQLEAEAAKVRV